LISMILPAFVIVLLQVAGRVATPPGRRRPV
jgi:hypothetical protein